jgi:hypothetical protein
MVATAYLLFALSAGNMPVLSALAAFPSEEACKKASAAVEAALSAGDEPQKVACISSASLQELGTVNGLGDE